LSKIARIEEKAGKSGPFLVVTLERTFSTARGIAITEEHDYVYRRDEPRPHAESVVAPLPAHAITWEKCADTVTVFQYSALVGASHRIHFDLDYARDVEGFPGLLIQGPLRALWLTSLLPQLNPGRSLHAVDFRHLRPAYHTERFIAAAWPEADRVLMELRNQHGDIVTRGSAEWAP
jgi:3-methylfumaryl-CoA hydratase